MRNAVEHLRIRAMTARSNAKSSIVEAEGLEKEAAALRRNALDEEKQAESFERGANLLEQAPDFAKTDGVK